MRALKFRLINDGKIVGFEMHSFAIGKCEIFHSLVDDDTEGWEWWNIRLEPKHWINHDGKEPFIGLHDKNGKEIYKGDIVSIPGIIPVEVGFDVGQFIQKTVGPDCSLIYWFMKHSEDGEPEVIGNKHENPELLQQKSPAE